MNGVQRGCPMHAVPVSATSNAFVARWDAYNVQITLLHPGPITSLFLWYPESHVMATAASERFTVATQGGSWMAIQCIDS